MKVTIKLKGRITSDNVNKVDEYIRSQLSKAQKPISITVEGMVSELISAQQNALLPMVFTEFGISIDER